ncbi:beta-lactamase family protein [Hyphobacterium sp. CCMP332]|nr:beta-lactamase family protein [Hyphobacterium sp. CCMP332]
MKKFVGLFFLLVSFITRAQLYEYFKAEKIYGHFNGVVLVKKDSNAVLEYTSGRDVDQSEISINTAFDIGSLSKQFTAAAILQLASEGKLDLHGFINTYLGEYASDRWKKVTIHQLLTHTSGIPSLYQTEQGLEIFMPEERPIALKDLINRFSDAKLLFSPGEEFSYSNSGYILLAAIIENISGQTYKIYMESKVFAAHDLQNTCFGEPLHAARPFYGYRNDLLKPAPVFDPSWYPGAGGIYSTAADLSKWILIIQNEDFLNEKLRPAFLKPQIANGRYGYGWQFAENGIIEHDGANNGFVSFLSFKAESNEHHVILTNRSFEDIHALGKSVNMLREWSSRIWKYSQGETIEPLSLALSDSLFSGDYYFEDQSKLTFTPTDTFINVSYSDGIVSRIIPKTSLPGVSESELRMIGIADCLERKKYWKFAKYCDSEMKFVSYFGLMRIGMNMMKKQVGKMISIIPYYVKERHGLMRMHGDKGDLDLIIYFDEEQKVKGVFDHGFYPKTSINEMRAYPIGNGMYYLDGFPYGEASLSIELKKESVVLHQKQKQIPAVKKFAKPK